jgi:hypothetical protein
MKRAIFAATFPTPAREPESLDESRPTQPHRLLFRIFFSPKVAEDRAGMTLRLPIDLREMVTEEVRVAGDLSGMVLFALRSEKRHGTGHQFAANCLHKNMDHTGHE